MTSILATREGDGELAVVRILIGPTPGNRVLATTLVVRRAEADDLVARIAAGEPESGALAHAEGAAAEVVRLREQRDALIKLHEYDELVFGGYICLHCTPDECDDPDDNVAWPCPSLRAIGMTDDEAIELIKARRAEIARKHAEEIRR